MCDVIMAYIGRGMFPALAAIFLLALDYTLQLGTRLYQQLPCTKICRTVEFRNASRNFEYFLVLIQLGAAHEDLIDLFACGFMNLL